MSKPTGGGGIFIHEIDYSDHFRYSDPDIDAVHFLRFDDAAWARYAGNRYMYANRLRHDDFLELFASAGHHILEVEARIDSSILQRLRVGSVDVHDKFRKKEAGILATTGAWIITAHGR